MAQVLAATSAHEPQTYIHPTPIPQRSRTPLPPPRDPSPLPSPTQTRTPSPERAPSPEYRVPSSQTSVSASPPRGSFQYYPRAIIYSSQPGTPAGNNLKDEEEISFPTYDDSAYYLDSKPTPIETTTELNPTTPATNEDSPIIGDSTPGSVGRRAVFDDADLKDEPSIQVDYLSHDWREEELWSSWKHIKSNRKTYGAVSRLENASWRTWTKSKYRLKTVSPETLNWLKDCDVTWLYGPLHKQASTHRIASEPVSNLSKNNSFLNKKPILKKRSVSEVMLQKSLSSSSLIKQAAAAVQAQRNCGGPGSSCQLSRTPSDFISSEAPFSCGNTAHNTSTFPSSPSSGLHSPESGRRHIRFDNKVEQCIAVDFKEGIVEEEPHYPVNDPTEDEDGDDDDDDGVVMMRTRSRKNSSTPGSSRGSFSQESKGIAMLPSTTIKFHADDSANLGQSVNDKSFASNWRSGRIPTSPSQETLRPTRPSANFLINNEEDESDMFWEPAGAFGKLRSDTPMPHDHRSTSQTDGHEMKGGLRRTPSGMFMPFDDDEEEEEGFGSTGILGRAVDTVNTFKDIAHVIWNVGWRK